MKSVSFTEMEHETKEDYILLTSLFEEHNKDLSDRLLTALEAYKEIYYGYKISRYEHALQCATRAYHNNEEDDVIVSCLFHDIGGELSPYNHGELAAAILKPFVSDKMYWIIKYHPIFQQYVWAHHIGGNRDTRDVFKSHPYYQEAIKFCNEYDQNSFDPEFESFSLDFFAPIVKRVFSNPRVTYKD